MAKIKINSRTAKAVQWRGFEKGPSNLGIVPLGYKNEKGEMVGQLTTVFHGFVVNPGDWIIIYSDMEKEVLQKEDFEELYTFIKE